MVGILLKLFAKMISQKVSVLKYHFFNGEKLHSTEHKLQFISAKKLPSAIYNLQKILTTESIFIE